VVVVCYLQTFAGLMQIVGKVESVANILEIPVMVTSYVMGMLMELMCPNSWRTLAEVNTTVHVLSVVVKRGVVIN
jgi:hypothetical protein